jgi:chaperone required for assembly of F1-ATPase
MSAWARKRFWKSTTVAEADGGFTVHLDGRPISTPLKSPLVVPTRGLAELMAAEWERQQGKIDPNTMPATRASNAAIDKVRGQQAEVTEIIAAYGDSDLICYRATAPTELVAREKTAWDPLVAWAESHFGATLSVRAGVMHVPQSASCLAALTAPLTQMTAFELTAFHDLVAMSGSLVIGLAVVEKLAPVGELWTCSRIDEVWQAELWGADEEAIDLANLRQQSFKEAATFFQALHID